MLHAVRLKIAPRDKRNLCILDHHGRSRKWTTIEDRQFGNRFARNVYCKNLFTAAYRCLENANFALCDNVQAIARLAFRKEQLPGTEQLANCSCG